LVTAALPGRAGAGRKRYPDLADWSDERIYSILCRPGKFGSVFPDFKDMDDALISRIVSLKFQFPGPLCFGISSYLEDLGDALQQKGDFDAAVVEGMSLHCNRAAHSTSYELRVIRPSSQLHLAETRRRGIITLGTIAVAGATTEKARRVASRSALVKAASPWNSREAEKWLAPYLLVFRF
jgi:hypothetical protein